MHQLRLPGLLALLFFTCAQLYGPLPAAQPAVAADRKYTSDPRGWPWFLGPQGNAVSPETGINKDWRRRPPRILWQVAMTDQGFSGPAVVDGVVYVLDHDKKNEIVRALDLDSGQEKWRYAYPDAVRPNYGYTRTTPAVSAGRVYTLGRFGMLHCLDAETGKKLWEIDLVTRYEGKVAEFWCSASPVIDGERLIVVPGGERNLLALDKRSGEEIWHAGNHDEPGYATPVIAVLRGRKQYIVFTGKNLVVIDPEFGNVLWRYKWQTRFDTNAACPIVLDGDRIFITTSYNHGCAMLQLTKQGFRKLWENRNLLAHFSTPIHHKGHIYGTSDPDYLVCLDAKTGKLRWKKKGFNKGGLLMVEDVLLVLGGKTGILHMVKTDSRAYRELGRIKPLGGLSWVAPVLADGRLLVRNRKAIACVDLR